MLLAISFIFAFVCVILLAVQISEERQARREAEERAEAKKRLAEQKKAECAALKVQKEAEKKANRRPVGRPRKNAAQKPAAKRPKTIPAASERSAEPANVRAFEHHTEQPKPENISVNNANGKPFTGEIVAFTGKLSITRGVACEAVRRMGGTPLPDMPARTTILVVGEKPGNGKLDKFDRWIGNGIRKMTAAEFMRIISQPADQPEPANVRALPPVSAALLEAPTAPQITEKPQGGEIYSPDAFAASFAA